MKRNHDLSAISIADAHHMQSIFRDEMFSMMAKHSPIIEESARGLAIRYDSLAPNRAGAMLPILLSEIVDVDKESLKRIGGAWYSLYLYTLLVDEQMDNSYQAKPIEYMAGTALLSAGLFELRDVVSGTEYQCIFEESIKKAIAGQAEDFEASQEVNPIGDRESHAIGKNMYLLALASVFAAVSGDGEKLLPFVRNLILAVQYLDDVSDFMEDFENKNFTALLSGTVGRLRAPPVNRLNLLSDLISSGSLFEILSTTKKALDDALMYVSDISSRGDALSYINALRINVCQLTEDLSRMRGVVSFPSVQINEIEEKLKRIAFSS